MAKGGLAATTSPCNQDMCTRSGKRSPRRSTSLRPPSQQHNLDGLEHNEQIQPERCVFDVEQIVLKLFPGVCQSISVFVLHLRPSGDARTHHVPYAVVRNLCAQPLHKFRTL